MIRCLRLRRYEKNTLKGFADLELVRTGIIIHDCPLHEKNGREWIGFPARSYQDKDGNIQWQALIEFAPGANQERESFRQQAVAAIHEYVDEEKVS